MSRFIGAVMLAAVAWWFAAALNVPVWRQWEPGDRCDIALFTFMAALWLTARRVQP